MENGGDKKYQPFDYYLKKKKNEESADEEEELTELQAQWNELSDKKKLKFIRKAEKEFDGDHESVEINKTNCFSKHVSHDELRILLELAYSFPHQIPENLKHYYMQKHGDGPDSQDAFSRLKLEEKEDLYNEFQSAKEDYYRAYVAFLDQLPQNRFHDYRRYSNPVNNYKKPVVKKKDPTEKKERAPRKKKEKKERPPKKPKKEKDETLKLPFEFYFEKNEERFMEHETKAYYGKLKARSEYKGLDDKKKLKFIKKCEAFFDENNPEYTKKLHTVLNKHELQLLFDSYSIPKNVPSNIYTYYTIVHYNDYSIEPAEKFKVISESYKAMSEEDKADFAKRHQKDLEVYFKKLNEFEAKLPAQRLEDYRTFMKKTPSKKNGENGAAAGTSGLKHGASDTTSVLDSEIEDLRSSDETASSPKKMKK